MISQSNDTVVFVVMAQSLVESFLPMRIALSEVITSLPTTSIFDLTPLDLELKKFVIQILTNDADGNSRELKIMGKHLKLRLFPKIRNVLNLNCVIICILIVPVIRFSTRIFRRGSKWVADELLGSTIPVQYVVHNEEANLRTRFLKITKKAKLIVPIGSHCESQSHILLMETVLKEKHDIRKSDITLEYKMNYDAVVRLCSPINCTKTYERKRSRHKFRGETLCILMSNQAQ
jgi:hypothetical protein